MGEHLLVDSISEALGLVPRTKENTTIVTISKFSAFFSQSLEHLGEP